MRPLSLPRSSRVRRLPAALLLTGLLAAGCAGGGNSAAPTDGSPAGGYPGWPTGPQAGAQLIPLIASSQLAVGPNRVLYSLTDPQNRLLNAPDLSTQLAFYDLAKDPTKPAFSASGEFIWAIQGSLGLYHASATFDHAGDWGVQITARKTGQPDRVARAQFTVIAKATTPAIGAQVPSVGTPTATDAAGIARISTDSQPDPTFYATSEATALAAHRPFVLVFATPKFCQTQICGPTLDNVKALAPRYASRMVFIHVEPYQLAERSGQLQPVLDAQGNLQLVPAAVTWGLPSEPWVFVVDGQGRLVAKFEGNFGQDELTAAIEQALGGS